MNILLTFTGFNDPYSLGLVGEEEVPGPILSLIAVKKFDRLVLFSTPNTHKNTSATLQGLEKLHPGIEVEVRDLPLADPTDYLRILKGLRSHLQEIIDHASGSNLIIEDMNDSIFVKKTA